MSKCYRQMNGGSIQAFAGLNACTNFASDDGFTPCCFTGSVCLSNSLCYTSNAASGSAGYYEALCSDPTFKDPSCTKKCTAYTKGDAIFDASANIWKCCGADSNGAPNCGNPTNATFTAPNPSVLLLQATGTASLVSTSTSSSATSSSTGSRTSDATLASSTLTLNSSSASAVPASNETNVGLIAGVVVGVVVVLLAIAALFFWLFNRKRRQQRTTTQQNVPTAQYNKVPTSYYDKVEPRDAPATPLPVYTYPAELSGETNSQTHYHQHGAKTTVYELGG